MKLSLLLKNRNLCARLFSRISATNFYELVIFRNFNLININNVIKSRVTKIVYLFNYNIKTYRYL